MVEAIKEEIIEEIFNDLDEGKLDDCNVQAPIILVGDTETKFIDSIVVERFDLIIDSYLMNIFKYMKTKEKKKIQVDLFIPLMSYKYGKKIKGLKHLKYLFICSGRFQISKMNSRTILFQVEWSNVGHDLLFNYCNLLFWYFYVKNVILGLGDLFPCF